MALAACNICNQGVVKASNHVLSCECVTHAFCMDVWMAQDGLVWGQSVNCPRCDAQVTLMLPAEDDGESLGDDDSERSEEESPTSSDEAFIAEEVEEDVEDAAYANLTPEENECVSSDFVSSEDESYDDEGEESDSDSD